MQQITINYFFDWLCQLNRVDVGICAIYFFEIFLTLYVWPQD